MLLFLKYATPDFSQYKQKNKKSIKDAYQDRLVMIQA